MSRRKTGRAWWALALFVVFPIAILNPASAQVLTPAEIKNPEMQSLQEHYMRQLEAAGAEIQAHVFPFPFYFSRVLDLELAQQQRADQRSLRFDTFRGMTVIELTGNYFGSYSTELVSKSHRALRTFQDVMLPILDVLVPAFRDNPDVEGFAMEISHHIRGKSMGQNVEHPENLVLTLSKDAAVRLVNAKSETDRQAAVLGGQFFFNGEPFILYLSDQAAQDAAQTLGNSDQSEKNPSAQNSSADSARSRPSQGKSANPSTSSSSSSRGSQRSSAPAAPSRDTSPKALAKIQSDNQKLIDLVARELDPQAHFVSYAPPAVVAFRKGAYVEFSVETTLPSAVSGSRYKMAALAFDDHISHLIRPMMAYLKADTDFDGIAFSTTIHQSEKSAPDPKSNPDAKFNAAQSGVTKQGSASTPASNAKQGTDTKQGSGTAPGSPATLASSAPQESDAKPASAVQQGSEAVEFFFPADALRCYESYDCTGQQLIDDGYVLINGERVSLNLELAE
jgi:hypothetical protein